MTIKRSVISWNWIQKEKKQLLIFLLETDLDQIVIILKLIVNVKDIENWKQQIILNLLLSILFSIPASWHLKIACSSLRNKPFINHRIHLLKSLYLKLEVMQLLNIYERFIWHDIAYYVKRIHRHKWKSNWQ